MKTCVAVDVCINVLLTFALNEGEWSASPSGRFAPGDRAPRIHWTEGCSAWYPEVTILEPSGTWNSDPFGHSARRCTDCATVTLITGDNEELNINHGLSVTTSPTLHLLFILVCLLGLLLDHVEGSSRFMSNADKHLPNYTESRRKCP
jgi:hypothetical protein